MNTYIYKNLFYRESFVGINFSDLHAIVCNQPNYMLVSSTPSVIKYTTIINVCMNDNKIVKEIEISVQGNSDVLLVM